LWQDLTTRACRFYAETISERELVETVASQPTLADRILARLSKTNTATMGLCTRTNHLRSTIDISQHYYLSVCLSFSFGYITT
jgi:hypothetical protein